MSGNQIHLKRILISVLIFVSLWGLVVLLCWRHGGFKGEFGDYPDEAAHYVTGLMIHDYIASFNYLSPLTFAEHFYVHYPKVAIGHWPPLFYCAEGLWMLVFSTSRESMMLFTGTLTTLLAFAIYRFLVDEFGGVLSLVAALVFVTLPLVQSQTGMVMTDIAVSLLCLLSAIYFGRYLDTENAGYAVKFGLLAAAAFMTKGSAFALAFVPPISILLTRRWRICSQIALWSSAVIVLVVCGPWYWVTRHISGGAWEGPGSGVAYWREALRFYPLHAFHILGWGLASCATVGLMAKISRLSVPKLPQGTWAALAGLICGTLVVCCAIPSGMDDRYLLPAIPALIAFALAGAEALVSRVTVEMARPALTAFGLLALILAKPVWGTCDPRLHFAGVSSLLSTLAKTSSPVVLVSSDSNGEGMLISEIAMHDRRPGHIVFRASKVLADISWNGKCYRAHFESVPAVLNYLRTVSVGVVILDNSVLRYEHQELLRRAVTSPEAEWKVAATYPIWRDGASYQDGLTMYVAKRTTTLIKKPSPIDIKQMTPAIYGTVTCRAGD